MDFLDRFKRSLEQRPEPVDYDVQDPAVRAWLADLELRMRAVEVVLYQQPSEPAHVYPEDTRLTVHYNGTVEVNDEDAFPPGYLHLQGGKEWLRLKSSTEQSPSSRVIIESTDRIAKVHAHMRRIGFYHHGNFIATHEGDGWYRIDKESKEE